MKHRYRITPKGRGVEPSEEELARLADGKRLMYEYQRAVGRPTVPLYRDPKAFLVLILIVLLAWLLSGGHGTDPVQDETSTEATDPAL